MSLLTRPDWGTPRLWTPALTALTTSPTLGVASVQTGRYFLNGKFCTFWGLIQFGTSGVVVGSGQYRVSLPFTTDAFHATRAPLGNLHVRVAGADTVGTVNWTTTTTGNLRNGAGAALTHAAGWVANDEIFFQGSIVVA